MNTALSNSIELAKAKAAYDNACKRILAAKEIASRILKEVAEEYKDCPVEDIMNYISDTTIGEEPVDPDSPPNVRLENSEDSTLTEGTRSFDIKFTARAPGDEGREIKLIINIEAQRKYNPGYSLLKRGIYYCCRLVSSQYGTDFTGSDYDRIKKVYSIWVCPNPTEKFRNTINKYSMQEESLYGEGRTDKKAGYDMLTLIMICLDGENISSENPLIELLSTIFTAELNTAEKKNILETKFSIPMTVPINKEVEAMCNLSEDIYEKGMSRGIDKGKAEGRAEGRAEGETMMLNNFILDKIRKNESNAAILDELGKYGVTEQLIEELRRNNIS